MTPGLSASKRLMKRSAGGIEPEYPLLSDRQDDSLEREPEPPGPEAGGQAQSVACADPDEKIPCGALAQNRKGGGERDDASREAGRVGGTRGSDERAGETPSRGLADETVDDCMVASDGEKLDLSAFPCEALASNSAGRASFRVQERQA